VRFPRRLGGSGGSTAGRPFGLLVHGRYDTEGAVRSVVSIVQALRSRQAAEVVEILGDVTEQDEERAYELGGIIAAPRAATRDSSRPATASHQTFVIRTPFASGPSEGHGR
jgi:hypothetical protein